MAKIGRPTTYNEDTASEILERIVQGESLRSIVKDDHMPVISTVFRWMSHNDEFSKQYAKAKEEQAEMLADEIIAIADEQHTTIKEHDGGTTEVTYDSVAVARNRLRVDARKWVASKLKPKKYGDKIDHEITGSVTLVLDNNDERI